MYNAWIGVSREGVSLSGRVQHCCVPALYSPAGQVCQRWAVRSVSQPGVSAARDVSISAQLLRHQYHRIPPPPLTW